jgi:two-component system, NtrC family, response regulator PilR
MDKIRAIVVDDEESVLEAVKAILETEDITADITTSGLEAVDMIRTNRYHLIISDMRMPEMDGLSLLRQARDISPESAFIVITAYSTSESEQAVLLEDSDEYIPKPFTPNEVREPVRRVLKKKGLVKEIAHTGEWGHG